ncbi:MAG: DNA-3-methyladenine glycosylase I [Cyclobacteriaceae bacterium]|nr:DNA-3-methyladenine glycosylase I [Cyclobacteriaceae bacterium]
MTDNYKDIFDRVENSLKRLTDLTEKEFEQVYSRFYNQSFRQRTDDEYFDILKMIVFYSGFKAVTVEKKEPIINKHFPDYKTVSRIDKSGIEKIMSDKDMIKNQGKISATVNNARTFEEIVKENGTFQNYIDKFSPNDSFENLMLLKEELEYKFDYLGGITVYHFLTDIGLNAIKPDRVLARIFKRLGLIENEKQLLKTVIQGRKFSEATKKPIRYVDIIFVKYGQQGTSDMFKIKGGICLETNPKCELCGVTDFCNFYKTTEKRASR